MKNEESSRTLFEFACKEFEFLEYLGFLKSTKKAISTFLRMILDMSYLKIDMVKALRKNYFFFQKIRRALLFILDFNTI